MKKLLTLTLAALFILSASLSACASEKVAVKNQDEIKLVVFKISDKNYYLKTKTGTFKPSKWMLPLYKDVAPCSCQIPGNALAC